MREDRHMFRLEPAEGPDGVRVLRPSDWETVSGRFSIELEVQGHGDIDVSFIESGPAVPHGSHGARTIAASRNRAEGKVTITPLVRLTAGPWIMQVIRRHDGLVLTATGIMVGLAPDEQSSALMRIGAARRLLPEPRPPSGGPFFSLTTTAWNTPPHFLRELADGLLAQTWTGFEWLILDNGSTEPQVVEALSALAKRDSRVRHFRVDANIHIIPGNRYLLERAAGDYVVPIDSDDLVAPDALERMAAYIAAHGSPALLFSDEQKISESGEALEYLWRSADDPLAALATCPASHLMAFSRQAGLDAGVYCDAYAQGSHDWDTYLRLTDEGAVAVHVPEVLYGWRVHATSAAGDDTVKDYLFDSQIAVVQQSLARRGLASKFDVRVASDHLRLSYFHATRRATDLPPIDLDIVVRRSQDVTQDQLRATLTRCAYPDARVRILLVGDQADADALASLTDAEVRLVPDDQSLSEEIARSDRNAPFKAVIDAGLRPMRDDWLRDAVGTMELDEAVGIVGGCITGFGGGIVHIGFVAGLDGFMATPRVGQVLASATKHAAYCRRRVTAVHGGLMLVRRSLFETIGPLSGVDADDSFNGIEFCLRARRAGWHTGYCPTFAAERSAALVPPALMDASRQELLRGRYADLLERDPYYNDFLSAKSVRYGSLERSSE